MTNKKALLSVIIPVYNGGQLLIKCVESILNSSYNDLEILLIDDGSEKYTYDICDKLAKGDSRIKVFHKKNEGIAATRNFGLEHATGEYIAFSDQDDLTDNEMYGTCIRTMEDRNSDLCICECKKILNDIEADFISIKNDVVISDKNEIKEKLIIPLLCKCNRMDFSFENSINDICQNYYGFIWNAVYKKEIIDKNNIRFIKFVDYEDDHLFILNYLKKCSSVSFKKNIFYFWRIINTSTSHSERYIDDIISKRIKLSNYYRNILIEIDVTGAELSKMTDELYQRDMIAIIRNESSPNNTKSNKDNVNYLMKAYKMILIDNSVKCRKKRKIELKGIRDYIIRYFICKGKIKSIYYFDKYIYCKFLIKIKNIFFK